jgi:hypothetical protein
LRARVAVGESVASKVTVGGLAEFAAVRGDMGMRPPAGLSALSVKDGKFALVGLSAHRHHFDALTTGDKAIRGSLAAERPPR